VARPASDRLLELGQCAQFLRGFCRSRRSDARRRAEVF
jgi:hypothetical protein